ncbi:patatin family protein [Marinobacter nanhaiticus D15-8W]|nr:patatin family protein [Marinobacter nanhaiticus D15-8W]
MRGIFAAGVLDAFMAQDYNPFDFTVGVSAGATNLVGYLAGDYGRSYRVITDHACRPDFINWKRFLRGGHLCDVHWLWHQSFNDVRLNFDRYLQQQVPLWVGTTLVRSGEPRYYRIDERNLHDVFTASCSLPVAYRAFPEVEGEPMTDGGMADSIPVKWAYEQGARDITVVLSKPLGFRKKPARFPALMRPLFRQQPALYDVILKRAEDYNRTLDFMTSPPDDCRVNIIAPPPGFPVSRLTTQITKLDQGYRQGISAGNTHLEQTATPVPAAKERIEAHATEPDALAG